MNLKERAQELVNSSKFTAGDYSSFSINLTNEVKLPGRYNPTDYITNLNIPSGKTALVVNPGNGGLCVELLNKGFDVTTFEHRTNYHAALLSVNSLISEASGKVFTHQKALEGSYDLIIWSEGLDQQSYPVDTFKTVVNRLSPQGTMFIEVTHGEQEVPNGSCNSWKPKEELFVTFLLKTFPNHNFRVQPGRLQRRLIYKITNRFTPKLEEKLVEKVEKVELVHQPTESEVKPAEDTAISADESNTDDFKSVFKRVVRTKGTSNA